MTSIEHQLFSEVFYTALAKYSGIGVSLVTADVLARLISPNDFGVVVITTVIIAFFNLFTDVGLSPTIIQHRGLIRENLPRPFSLTVWAGIGLALLFAAASRPIAAYYNREILRALYQLLTVNLFLAFTITVPSALFYRNKEFKFVALRSFTVQIAIGTAAVVAALCGAGLYVLVIRPILSDILIFVVSIRRYPQRLRLTLGLGVLRRIFSYSAYQLLFNIINYFSRDLDELPVGKYMGMSPLGYYEKSYHLMMLPLQNITQVIIPVTHPIFNEYQNGPECLILGYECIVRFLAFIGLSLSVLLYLTTGEVTLILFDDQWMPSISIFRILTLSVGIQIVLSPPGSIFQAVGDAKSPLVRGLLSLILNVAGILLDIFRIGMLQAAATCITLTFTINFVQYYWMMYRMTLYHSLQHSAVQLVSPLAVSVLLIVILYPLSLLAEGGDTFLTLIVESIIFFCMLGCYVQLTGEYDIIGKAEGIPSKRKSRG